MIAMLCWADQFWRPIAVLFVLLSRHRPPLVLMQSCTVLLHAAAKSASGIVHYTMAHGDPDVLRGGCRY